MGLSDSTFDQLLYCMKRLPKETLLCIPRKTKKPLSGNVPKRGGNLQTRRDYALTCAEMCLVISNIVTWLLPPKTALRAASALIMVFFFSS